MFQLFALIIFVGSISISAYHRRKARSEGGSINRRDEGILFILGRLFVALPLFGGTVLYIINPAWMAWASFPAPIWLQWFGVGIGLLSIPAVYLVLRALGKNVSETVLTKNQQELVKKGPYRRIRHPLYSTGIMLFTALGLIAANWFILTFTGLALMGVRLIIIPREEKELQARFGDAYTQYIRESGALIPRFSKRR